jgi:hypothetical protein
MAMKKYEKMSRTEKKVAIAKDVIAQIKAKKLKVASGYGYVVGDLIDDLDVLKKYLPSQEIACKMQKECSVCARGAMMLSRVAKFNNYEFTASMSKIGIDNEDTFDALKDAFTQHELDIIECCFEGWICGNLTDEDIEDYDIDKWSNIEDDEDRLMAIMQCIIDHKGVFRPEVEYKIVKS